jgi:type II secretion system protein H
MLAIGRTTSGFTLLELVLVLAIIATALLAVAPSLSGVVHGRKPEEVARRFVALTRYARSQAVTEGVTYQVCIDARGRKWWLGIEDDDAQSATAVDPADTPFGKVYSLPDGVALQTDLPATNGQQTLTFDPTGRSDVGSVHFVGQGIDVEVACDAPVDEFRIVKDAEVRR